MGRFLWVCLGGAFGTGARYLLSGWAVVALGSAFPWGTLAVNVLGSFFLSGIVHVALTTNVIAPTVRLALTTGVMGGFTTYSTFNYETLGYLREGAWTVALGNVLATLLLCLAAGIAGLAVARGLVGG
jgi:CrcB protein